MTELRQGQERRTEGRVPVSFPVTMFRGGNDQRFNGSVCDISCHGLRTRMGPEAAELAGAEVAVTVAAYDQVIETSASVRWARTAADDAELGLQLTRPLELMLPLPDAAAACARLQATRSAAKSHPGFALLQNSLQEFFPFTFGGMLFWNLCDLIHSKHTFASGACSLASFRLSRVLDLQAGRPVTPAPDQQGLRKTIDDLDQVVTLLKRLSAAYREVKDRFGPRPDAAPPALFDINQLLARTVQNFSRIAAQLNDESHLTLHYQEQAPELLFGPSREISICIEAILLQAYLSARFGGGTSLKVFSRTDHDHISLYFANDASALLSPATMRIKPMDGQVLNGLSARDRRTVLWLHTALALLQRPDAEIAIRSESGLNEVVLRMRRES